MYWNQEYVAKENLQILMQHEGALEQKRRLRALQERQRIQAKKSQELLERALHISDASDNRR